MYELQAHLIDFRDGVTPLATVTSLVELQAALRAYYNTFPGCTLPEGQDLPVIYDLTGARLGSIGLVFTVLDLS